MIVVTFGGLGGLSHRQGLSSPSHNVSMMAEGISVLCAAEILVWELLK